MNTDVVCIASGAGHQVSITGIEMEMEMDVKSAVPHATHKPRHRIAAGQPGTRGTAGSGQRVAVLIDSHSRKIRNSQRRIGIKMVRLYEAL